MAEPVLEASRCTSTGLWLMPLETKTNGSNQASNIEGVTERVNAIFELPSTRQTILYHHALAGFPIKETFLNAVRSGNYATWPGLTIAALHKYFPNSDKTQKGHMKGQQQGIHSTKQKALDHLVESEKLEKSKWHQARRRSYQQNATTTYSSTLMTWPRASTPTKQAHLLTPCSKATATS